MSDEPKIHREKLTEPSEFPDERWEIVPCYPNYAVSSLGRVRSVSPRGRGFVPADPVILKGRPNGHGYLCVKLSNEFGSKNFRIHGLVAAAFVRKADVNHRDGNKQNNRCENLEYVSRSENVSHAYRSGLMPDRNGENGANSKLTASQVEEIRSRRLAGESVSSLSKAFPVSPSQISKICRGDAWSNA